MISWLIGVALLLPPVRAHAITTYTYVSPEPPPVVEMTWREELDTLPELRDLAVCESGISESAVNPLDVDGKQKYGVFQYDVDTWSDFTTQMGYDGDILSGKDQLAVTKWAMANGYRSRWGVCLD